MSEEISQEYKPEQEEDQKPEIEISEDENPAVPKPQEEIIEKNMEISKQHKEEGNSQFKINNLEQAIEEYSQGIKFCPDEEIALKTVLNSNIGICHLRLADYDQAIHYTTLAINIDNQFKKAYLNRSKAFQNTEREDEALEDLQEALKIDPQDKHLQAQIFIMEKEVKASQEKKKDEVLSGLKDIGNSLLGNFGLSLDNFKMNPNQNGSYNISFNQ